MSREPPVSDGPVPPTATSEQSAAGETPHQSPVLRRWHSDRRWLIAGGVGLVLLLVVGILSLDQGAQPTMPGGGGQRAIMLVIPAFLAGLLSFLSPCTLPVLPAYFAFTFQASKKSIVLMSVAFFLGLATTLSLLGAAFTALGSLVQSHRETLMVGGGVLIILFGFISFFGKGFAGPQMKERPVASVAGSYLYGATFALGWTACLGPILGALFTLLASQGIAIVQGVILSFVYALGLGMPLMLIATFFSQLGSGSRFWKLMRGKGFEVRVGPWTLYLHTTSMMSGVLLIIIGVLLATNSLTALTSQAQANPFFHWLEDVYFTLSTKFRL
ncbi:MAG: cytochrome c biogenesis protein CcdA [Chloroflexaceae bacterium]|nr:cytochrome c biogenesis protein CcdA [Chloroflexaceae bacterium]